MSSVGAPNSPPATHQRDFTAISFFSHVTVAAPLVVAILDPALSDQYQASLYCVCMTSGGFRGCQGPPPITDTCEAPQTPYVTPTDCLCAGGAAGRFTALYVYCVCIHLEVMPAQLFCRPPCPRRLVYYLQYYTSRFSIQLYCTYRALWPLPMPPIGQCWNQHKPSASGVLLCALAYAVALLSQARPSATGGAKPLHAFQSQVYKS